MRPPLRPAFAGEFVNWPALLAPRSAAFRDPERSHPGAKNNRMLRTWTSKKPSASNHGIGTGNTELWTLNTGSRATRTRRPTNH
ncbi:hypothetical protein F5Y14DRAFT_449852 [Nemania sp. NC0429]|nr:hypothetical protein F5Y14DRAFT_449852 [Nemania sp. NC0429]